MLDVNKTVQVGRLTRDPELKTTPNGVNVCSFRIAVSRRFKDANGKYPADFIPCVAWRNEAEYLCKYGSKGQYVTVSGSIQTRNYTDKDGKKVFVAEVVADDLSLGYQKDDQSQNNFSTPSYTDNVQNTRTAQNNSQGVNNNVEDPFAGSGDTVEIDNNDLPF